MSDTDSKILNKALSKEDDPIHIVSNALSFDSNDLYTEEDGDPKYLHKAKLVAEAIDTIGFGRYQWGLFFVAGFGWFSDNAWPVITSLVLVRLTEDDGVKAPEGRAPYLTLAQNLGLLVGAAFWSLTSDIIGRKWAFNLTFLITGIFGVAAGASPNFAALGVFSALWSFGVGGNLPVDSAIFLEALPTKQQWILTIMSSWWALGQIVTTLVSWGLISNYSCDPEATVCLKKDNKGWRYLLYTMGGLTLVMFAFRFAFRVFESPRFYLARGDNARTIEALDKIAKINKSTNPITIEDLEKLDALYDGEKEIQVEGEKEGGLLANNELLKEKFRRFDASHIRQCFGNKRLAISSSLVIFVWGLIGLAFPLYNAFLPYYLQHNGYQGKHLSVRESNRNSLVIAVVGIPGALIAGLLVELRIGRKGALCGSLILTGVVLFASTTAKSANVNLAWNCLFSLFSNMMYSVLYAYTPEIFYTKIRGTGVGLSASFNRVMGVFAPIIAIFANLTTSAPIFVSGAFFLASGILSLTFPFEPNGKSSL